MRKIEEYERKKNMKQRFVSMLLVLSMVFALLPIQAFAADAAEPVDTANPFEDVEQGSWYYDAVQYVRVNGLFYGTTETTFAPDGAMTRGMFVTVLGRMAGVNPDNYAGPSAFTDVPESAYYAPYVAWAAKYGITVGTGDGKFSPDAYINRQQMAVFFERYFDTFGVDYETGADITSTPADLDSISPWARDAVLKLWRTGLLVGNGENFDPTGSATRGQVATICCRIDEAVTTWYSEPGVPSARVRIDPATGLPFEEGNTPSDPSGNSVSSIPSSQRTVKFFDGSRLIKSFRVKRGEPLGQVPTVAESSKAGHILEGYYTDPDFTTPFYAENPVTGNMNVYAKYESMGDAETLTLDSFARMDQDKNVTFRFKAVNGTGTLEDAQAAVTLAVKDGSDPVEITISGSGGVYTVSAPAGFNPGCSYELNLADGWTFLPDGSDTIPGEVIRTAAFSIEMAEVENLSMNSGIRYVKDTDSINYTYTDKDNNSHSNVAELPTDADITNGGSFNYSDTTGWQSGDILCIYVGGKPDSNEAERTEEAIYAKVQSISGDTVSFVPLETEDQMRLYEIPDNFPIQVDALPAGNTGTVSINALDTALYAQMVGAAEGTADKAEEKLSVGDFVSLYVDANEIDEEGDVYFGRITGISGDTITYDKSSAEEIEESANLYKSANVENTDYVTEEEAAQIETIVQAQVEQSNFAEEAAYVLADMAVRTEGFQDSVGLMSISAADESGAALSDAQLAAYADAMVLSDDDDDGEPDVETKVSVVLDKDKLHFGNKGVQLAVEVTAQFEVDAQDEGKIHFDLSATFVQEVAVDPKVKGSLVYKKILKFIPVPTGVQVNAIVDVKSYTAMSLKADIYTEGPEEQSTWEKFKAFTKDPSELANIPGLPDGLTDGLKTVGDAIDKIEELQDKLDKGLETKEKLEGYAEDIELLWSVIQGTNPDYNEEEWASLCEALGKTNVAGELMEMLHLSEDEISADYYHGLDELMDKYSEMLEKETDWVQLVDAEMFDASTPPEFGIMVGVEGKFVVRADVNITLGTNLEYEVGKRYNFWFRVGLFKPTSGSSTMDLIDEHFAFQFYVMGKLGLKTGVRLKIYAAIGSKDAVSVGITTELGPYLKLWGFFIYDYSKYRPANTASWTSKEQMAGALYLEFGLYLMVGMEAKALFLEFDKDFMDKEFPLLEAGDKFYYYNTAYEPLDDEDEIVVYNDGSAALQEGCAVSMLLPEDTYALKVIDLTTGKQSTAALDFNNYTFKVSNPNFRVENVDGKPVVSVVSIPENVRLMQCDLTITYKHGKLAFSTFDMSATVHLAWTNMTAAEYQQVYTASVTVPDGNGGREVIWSKRVRKGAPFDLPTADEIKSLLSWSDAKYTEGAGYGSQTTEGVTLIENTQYNYDLGYQTYALTVNGIQVGGSGSQTFTGKYGEPFDFSALTKTGTDGPEEYTRFAGLTMGGESIDLSRPITGSFAEAVRSGANAAVTAQYVDETVTATFQFTGLDHADMEVKLRKGSTPDTTAILEAVPSYLTVTGFYPSVGPVDGDTAYQVVCEIPAGKSATVTFNANNGDAASSVTKPIGSVLGALPTPARTGYTFDGWFTDDGTFANQVDANTVVNGAMTLYAKWTAASVTVTFNSNGGVNLGASEAEKAVTYGDTYGILPTPERSGHGFRGWWTTADETGAEVTASTIMDTTEDHILYAHWVELKTIPDTVFDFGAQETATYDKTGHTAAYTFTPETGESYTEDSFTVSYTRVADEFRSENTDEGTAPVTAGKYNVTIHRDADDTYATFDQNYTDVLTIERATPNLTGVVASDLTKGEQGLTYQKMFVNTQHMSNVDKDTYFIYRVQVNGTVYVYDNAEVESGLLYDLAPGGTYTILTVGTAGDINHEAAQSGVLNVSVSTNPAPTGSWADHVDTSWYDSNDPQTEYTLTTAAQLAGWSKLSKQTTNRVTFDGVTIKLGGDIDLSAYQWVPIASFGGTLDGQGHTICGVYVSAIASGGEGFIDSAAENTIIQNVTLEDSYIHPWDNTRWDYGGLIAKPYSPTLKNCHSTAFADGPNPAGRRFIGNSTTFPTTLENCGTPRPNVKKGS